MSTDTIIIFSIQWYISTISIVLETDPSAIVARVSKPRENLSDVPLSEQTLIQAYQTAKEKFGTALLK